MLVAESITANIKKRGRRGECAMVRDSGVEAIRRCNMHRRMDTEMVAGAEASLVR